MMRMKIPQKLGNLAAAGDLFGSPARDLIDLDAVPKRKEESTEDDRLLQFASSPRKSAVEEAQFEVHQPELDELDDRPGKAGWQRWSAIALPPEALKSRSEKTGGLLTPVW
jgi:hypothetical protein